ncbi:unnamed protein product [Kuraishia capsulata CBS 1993]|uniref:alpha-1,2-Mannosidase n=1 Tax=Kuraishia capsulata CBS 1993 TaxID=1382522 RepID=W6MXI7_9ASCO|nr:uncharacterized protein KUCA_T00004946001 [Kuraishia capsulata CBS 1993]CDK28960.1 unnamed protein product [Kuraishia capsulata CBS 1993]
MSSYIGSKRPSTFDSGDTSITSTFWKAKNKPDLPLYKDKPKSATGFLTTHRKRMVFKLFLLSIALYLLHYTYSLISSTAAVDPLTSKELWQNRRDEVKKVFQESWKDYEKHGWGNDVYHPIKQTGKDMGSKPLGWIIVDSLDTLMLMDLKEELHEARSWVKNELTYDFDYDVNVFETTIRMLGGLLSAFYLSQDEMYLDKAVNLGNKIIGAFDSPSGIPYASVNLQTGKGIESHVDRGASSTAEVATLQLEFKYLAKLTGENLYWEKVEKVMEVLDSNQPVDGLVPIYVHPKTGKYQDRLIRLGSRGDSYYEYLLKQYLQTSSEEGVYLDMYREAVKGIKTHLINKSLPNGLTYIGELPTGIGGDLSPKMDHLVCFVGGLFALGATSGEDVSIARKASGWSAEKEEDFSLGREIARTCYKMYHDVEGTGLAPEIVVFNSDQKNQHDFFIKPLDKHNLQRPETVETLYYMYRMTKDPIYRDWGWEIFQNFVKHTKVTSGGKDNAPRYTSLDDVTSVPPKKRDNMESFWLAETLKYLYLLFDDSDNPKWDIKNVVYNTEAHPLPKFEMSVLFKTGWVRSKLGEDEAQAKKKETIKDAEKKPSKEKPVIQADRSSNDKQDPQIKDEAEPDLHKAIGGMNDKSNDVLDPLPLKGTSNEQSMENFKKDGKAREPELPKAQPISPSVDKQQTEELLSQNLEDDTGAMLKDKVQKLVDRKNDDELEDILFGKDKESVIEKQLPPKSEVEKGGTIPEAKKPSKPLHAQLAEVEDKVKNNDAGLKAKMENDLLADAAQN